MRLYNTRTRRVEPFAPLRDNTVRMYVCGITPSAQPHLGHARSFAFFDVLRRYLLHRGYRVIYVQNVTDIDDRSIEAARATGRSWNEIVAEYYASFKASMLRLSIRDPDHEPRATDFISQIIEMTARLVEKDHAYVVGDGVYFRVKSFAGYGALSGHVLADLRIGARIAPGEEKDDPLDFALWKFAKPGEPRWPSPWGDGRPGWHIECSAMAHAILGEPFDIHGGGYDLIFPHHENEIAQSESLLERPPMANFWMYAGLLMRDGKKMSKSLGNFEPLACLLERHDPQALRYLFLQTGYRKPMNFSEESIVGATEGLHGLFAAYDRLSAAAEHEVGSAGHARKGFDLEKRRRAFYDALDDDMNTSGALGELFGIAHAVSLFIDGDCAREASEFFGEAMDILGISPLDRSHGAQGDPLLRLGADFIDRLKVGLGDLPALNGEGGVAAIQVVIAARAAARRSKDFALADRLRSALAQAGVTLSDGTEGTTWSVDG